MNKTALIILNYNNSHDTRNCLESILKYNTAPVKFIVVDNASNEEDRNSLHSMMSDIFGDNCSFLNNTSRSHTILPYATLLEINENCGYARGNNAGLALAYNDPEISHVMILNNDILFVEDIINPLLEKTTQLPNYGIISPLLYKKDLKEYDYNCARKNISVPELIKTNFLHYIRKSYRKRIGKDKCADLINTSERIYGCIKIDLPSGSCMLFDKALFKSIDSFDPNTFLYFEENILYKKISAKGKQNFLDLDTKCVHLGAASTSQIPDNKWLVKQSKLSERYYVSNYSEAGQFMKALHTVSVKFFMFSFYLQKLIKNRR